MLPTKKDIVDQLRKEILLVQGFRRTSASEVDIGLGPIAPAFPNSVLPTGVIHEFISSGAENSAASGGFVAALTAPLMRAGGACIWISSTRKLFPPGLKTFGIEPDQCIFVDLKREKEVLWATEEVLKCEGLAAVVVEIQELSFTLSRRLQLAVEQSRVTGFILRHNPRYLSTTACVARWKITSLASHSIAGMPGLGFPRWKVELERVKNGHPGIWDVEYSAGLFHPVALNAPATPETAQRKTG
jgi:protein ImuA